MKILKRIKWLLVGGLIISAPALFSSQAAQAETDAAGYFNCVVQPAMERKAKVLLARRLL